MLPLAALVVLVFDLPLVWMLVRSLFDPDFTLRHYTKLIESPVYFGVMRNTLSIALITTALCVPIGYVIAYWIVGLPQKYRAVTTLFVIVPFWVSILVRTYAWIVLLGDRGIVNNVLVGIGLTGSTVQFLYNNVGVVIGMLNVLLPFVVLPLIASMSSIDPSLVKAARSLGSSRAGSFFRVFFPLSLPALAACTLLTFILALGFFITPAILGGGRVPVIATLLDTLINVYPNFGLAAALSLVVILTTGVILGLFSVLWRLLPVTGTRSAFL